MKVTFKKMGDTIPIKFVKYDDGISLKFAKQDTIHIHRRIAEIIRAIKCNEDVICGYHLCGEIETVIM